MGILRHYGVSAFRIKINKKNKYRIRIPKPVYMYALKEAELISKETNKPLEEVLIKVLNSDPIKNYMKRYMEYVEVELYEQ